MGGWRGRRRAAAGMAAVVLATGVVACGGESEQARAQDLILGAAEATFEAGTAQVLVTLGDDEGEGQVDFEAGQSEVTLDRADGDGTVWVDGSDVYLGVDDVVTMVDPDDPDPLGPWRALLLELSPTALIQLLEGLVGEVEIVGDETIDGVEVVHYSVRVDVERLLEELEGEARELLELLLELLGSDGIDIDVWLDDEGRIVRMEYEVDAGDEEPIRFQLGLQEFGSDVDIDIPEVDEVVDAEEFGRATADIGGQGWTGTTLVTSSTLPGYTVGPLEEDYTLNLRCRPDGSCRNRESGNAWEASGPGAWTVSSDFLGDCTDTATGAVTTPDGYRETTETTWTVTAYDEDGQATELTMEGTVHGEVTPAGLADGCTIGGTPGSPVSGDVTLEATATRS